MSETYMSQIEISTSNGESHPLIQAPVLEDVR